MLCYFRRFGVDYTVKFISACMTLSVLFLLCCIIWTVGARGASAISVATFVQPMISGVGFANAIIGSIIQVVVALVIAIPIGIMTGTYLYDSPRDNWYAAVVRFVNDVLLAVPSILLGLFIYILVVRPLGNFSAWSGSMALALVMLPIIIRTSEDVLSIVPNELKEAAFSLGSPHYKVIVSIMWRASRPGIFTGILLSVARATGETAPLLFTSMGNPFWSFSMSAPMASLPVMIYQYSGSPIASFVSLAWAGALVITVIALLLSILAASLCSNKWLY